MKELKHSMFGVFNMCKDFECGYSSSMGDNVLYVRYNGKPYYITITEMQDIEVTERLRKKYSQAPNETNIQDLENIKLLERLKKNGL